MNNQTRVSVILLSYNHAKYLRDAIDSVLNQTYSDFDLIIWDDASTDESWEIISDYTDPRIRAFRNKVNTGSGNINRAILEEATGEYIAIHHSDDVWLPQKLEKQVAFLDSNSHVGAVFSNALIIGENDEPLEDKTHFYYSIFDQPNRSRFEWLNHFFYNGNALCHPSVLIRKECYSDCGLYRDGLNQIDDFDMWVRLCLKYDIYVLPEKLVKFRVQLNEMNVSGNSPGARIRGQFEFLQVLYNYREIVSYEEFVKIFPPAQEYIRSGDFDIDYALGMISLETGKYKFTELFGLVILFEALNNAEKARKIYELYKFSHNDFIKLTAKHDVFSIETIADLKDQLHTLSLQVNELQSVRIELENIYNNRAWKVAQFLQRLRLFLVPSGSFREKLFRFIFRS